MSEIGSERVEPTVRVPDRLGNEPRGEPRPRPRRQPAPDSSSSEAEDNPETPQHQIDSLA
jgi:hypothetical protein